MNMVPDIKWCEQQAPEGFSLSFGPIDGFKWPEYASGRLTDEMSCVYHERHPENIRRVMIIRVRCVDKQQMEKDVALGYQQALLIKAGERQPDFNWVDPQ